MLLEAEETCRASKCCSAVLLRGSLLLIELESWKKNERKCAALTRESSPLPYIFLSPYLSLSLSLSVSLSYSYKALSSQRLYIYLWSELFLSLSLSLSLDLSALIHLFRHGLTMLAIGVLACLYSWLSLCGLVKKSCWKL